MSGNRIMVAAIDPPKMMMTACSLHEHVQIAAHEHHHGRRRRMPDTSPTLVMISMENSNAYANDRPSWTVAQPIPRPRK